MARRRKYNEIPDRPGLVNRNVTGATGRTSMRLEPELWRAIEEICHRQNITSAQFITSVDAKRRGQGRTSAVRVAVLEFFRKAATEEGHAAAGHGRYAPAEAEDLRSVAA